MPDTLRLFIAVELLETARDHVEIVLRRLQRLDVPGIRWVRPDSVHLTLKFLGDVPIEDVLPVTEAMEQAASGTPSQTLRLDGAGVFPNARLPRVVWLGVQGDIQPLALLQSKLEEALEVGGFAREDRAFTPHLTLGRVRGRLQPPELEKLKNAVNEVSDLGTVEMSVDTLSLMESQQRKEGALYQRVAKAVLR
jgi:2'-5' RNA ligase